MKINSFIIPTSLLLFSGCQYKQESQKPYEQNINLKPNIIYILADDLGYGDLSSYGQVHFSTPNIDYLADNGMKFIQHYSGSTVSAPSRSSLMTGMHTGHTYIRGNKEWQPEGQFPLKDDEYTLAELLKDAGYTTGAFGKWGLGYPGSEGDPNNQGFDVFFGYNCQRLGHHYYPYHMWHNQEKVILEGNTGMSMEEYGPEIIHKKALKFIEENKDVPFFMFYPTIIPHAELFAPEEYMAKHRGRYEPETSYLGVDDGEKFRNGPYGSQQETHTAYAAMIDYLDFQVGEITQKLKELDLYENTIIIFSSDNGPHQEGGADPDYFNSSGGLRGYKRDLYEGGIRVPMLVVWDGVITAGSITDHTSAFWDVFPTISDIIEVENNKNIDGVSFLPTLIGNELEQKNHEYLYWEFHELGGRKALRKDDWKLVIYNTLNPRFISVELYNLSADPGENINLADNNPGIVKELSFIMDNARVESDIFSFEQEYDPNEF